MMWFEKVMRSIEHGDTPQLGSRLIHGDDAPLKASNVLHNLKSGAITVVQAAVEPLSH